MEDPRETPEEAPKSKAKDELAARAAELYKEAKPKVDEMVTRAKPRVEEAGREAARYVREHEGEIKKAASTVARMRLPLPFRLFFDAMRPEEPEAEPSAEIKCASCAHINPPAANFCNQCGSGLTATN